MAMQLVMVVVVVVVVGEGERGGVLDSHEFIITIRHISISKSRTRVKGHNFNADFFHNYTRKI